MFCGWYWHRQKGGRVVQTDVDGPFSSESAAVRDAYVKLQLHGVGVVAQMGPIKVSR